MAIDNRAPQIAAVTFLFLFMTTIAVSARIYCRAVVKKAFGLDDYLCVAAQAFFITFSVFELIGIHYGTGQHTSAIAPNHLPLALRSWWACEPLFVLSNMFLKMAIGVFLLRICVVQVQRNIIYVVVGLTELYSVFFFFIFVLQCRPTSYFWTRYAPEPPKGHCINANITTDAFFGYSVIACLTDWTLAILPVFLVKDLQMNRQTKLSVAAILSVGAIASTATIVRIPYLHRLTDAADFLYATSDVAIWSTAETGIGLTAASVATLRPLFNNFFNRSKMFGGSSSNPTSAPWPKSGITGTNAGYTRSGPEEFALRNDIGVKNGITTTVKADTDGKKHGNKTMDRTESQGDLKEGRNDWGDGERISDDDSSDDFNLHGQPRNIDWGIRKTVVQTQVDTHMV